MKKIINWLTHWDKDKVLHFTLSFLIAIIAGCFVKLIGGEKYQVLAAAWFAGFFAGVTKEIYDEWKYKGADESDWAADIVGTTLGGLVGQLIQVIVIWLWLR